MRRGHIFKCFQRLFRFALLHKPHDRIEDDDEDDECRLHEFKRFAFSCSENLVTDDAEGDTRRNE